MMAEDIADAAVRFQTTPKEMEAALAMRQWYKDVFGMDKAELHRFLHEGIPKLREVNGDLSKLKDYTLPKGMAELIPSLDDGFLSMHDDSALGVARDVLHSLGRERYMREVVANGRAMLRQLSSVSQKDPTNRQLYDGAKEVLGTYLDTVTNRVPNDAAMLSEAFGQWSGFLKKLRLIEGDTITPKDIERLAMMGTSWYGGLAMSGRLALVVRNLTQSMLSAPKVGFLNAARGVKAAINAGPEGRAELVKAGIINEPAMWSFASWYRGADQFNRAATYFAGKRALEHAWAKYQKGGAKDIETFYVDSGLAGDSKSFRRDIARMLGRGQLEEAAHEYGKHVSRITQYLYSRPNVPQAFQGVKGRMFGQFGIWPLWLGAVVYESYLGTGGCRP
jgi:hypothetical protein